MATRLLPLLTFVGWMGVCPLLGAQTPPTSAEAADHRAAALLGQGALRWLGQTELAISTDHQNTWSSKGRLALLLPWYQEERYWLFNQLELNHARQDTTLSLGVGQRWWHTLQHHPGYSGYNLFFDYRLQGNHNRLGIGVEHYAKDLLVVLNGYWPLSDWRALEGSPAQERRPARGLDLQLHYSPPHWQQFRFKAATEHYFDNAVILFGNQLQRQPTAFTLGTDYTPMPLITLSYDCKFDAHHHQVHQLKLNLVYRLGMPLTQQLDRQQVSLMRTLEANQFALVQRHAPVRLQQQARPIKPPVASPTGKTTPNAGQATSTAESTGGHQTEDTIEQVAAQQVDGASTEQPNDHSQEGEHLSNEEVNSVVDDTTKSQNEYDSHESSSQQIDSYETPDESLHKLADSDDEHDNHGSSSQRTDSTTSNAGQATSTAGSTGSNQAEDTTSQLAAQQVNGASTEQPNDHSEEGKHVSKKEVNSVVDSTTKSQDEHNHHGSNSQQTDSFKKSQNELANDAAEFEKIYKQLGPSELNRDKIEATLSESSEDSNQRPKSCHGVMPDGNEDLPQISGEYSNDVGKVQYQDPGSPVFPKVNAAASSEDTTPMNNVFPPKPANNKGIEQPKDDSNPSSELSDQQGNSPNKIPEDLDVPKKTPDQDLEARKQELTTPTKKGKKAATYERMGGAMGTKKKTLSRTPLS